MSTSNDDDADEDEPGLNDIEPGVIMRLSGLSKVELNGTIVEVDKKIIAQDGTFRWSCIPIKDDNINATPMSIKPENLERLPTPSQSEIKRSEKLLTEGITLFKNARNTNNRKNLTLAREKLQASLNILPQNGQAYNVLGDIAFYENKSHAETRKYMRRAVANCLDTPEDVQRVLKARFGYSGSLVDSMNDYAGERYQLRLMLNHPDLEKHLPNASNKIKCLIGNSYRQQGKLKKAVKVLLELKKSKPKLGLFFLDNSNVSNLDEELHRLLYGISYNFYKTAMDIEGKADKLTNENEKIEQYKTAKEWFNNAILAAPEDKASQMAWIRIQSKLNPNAKVSQFEQNGKKMFSVLNTGAVDAAPLKLSEEAMRCFNPDCKKQDTLNACSKCRLVYYCSKECQKSHWKAHKPSCISPNTSTS